MTDVPANHPRFPSHIRLWAAVLRRAAVDSKLYGDDADPKCVKIGDDARAWLSGRYNQGVFNSVASVCDMLGLPLDVVLERVELLTEEDARRQRGMEFDD